MTQQEREQFKKFYQKLTDEIRKEAENQTEKQNFERAVGIYDALIKMDLAYAEYMNEITK